MTPGAPALLQRDWSRGSKMPFLAPAANGESGMVSRIKDSGP